jgi:hypothetical protein
VTQDGRALFLGDDDHALELLEAADAVTVLPTPIVPLHAFDAGEVALAKFVTGGTDDETGTSGARQLYRCADVVEITEIDRGLSDEAFGLRQTRRFLLQGQELAHQWSKGSEPIACSLPGNSVVTWLGRPSTRNENGVNIKRGS